jgi:hypothetical protein
MFSHLHLFSHQQFSHLTAQLNNSLWGTHTRIKHKEGIPKQIKYQLQLFSHQQFSHLTAQLNNSLWGTHTRIKHKEGIPKQIKYQLQLLSHQQFSHLTAQVNNIVCEKLTLVILSVKIRKQPTEVRNYLTSKHDEVLLEQYAVVWCSKLMADYFDSIKTWWVMVILINTWFGMN